MNIVVRQSCLCVGTPTNNTKTPECDVQRFSEINCDLHPKFLSYVRATAGC